jgi:hypothetical protein
MTRIARAWGALGYEQRIATAAALALLVTMFLPWYDLQSLNRKTGAINSHSISAFGDVSFVEAAVFLVAAGVIALMFARAERKDFHMPGSDGAVVMAAGAWAALLIFYRVFSRPAGHGYPVGIEWGFFLAFVAAGALGYAGWRMRATAAPEAPLMRPRGRQAPERHERHERTPADEDITTVVPTRRSAEQTQAGEDITTVVPTPRRAESAAPAAARPARPSPQEDPTPRPANPADETAPLMEQAVQPPQRTTPNPPPQKPITRPKRPRFPPPPSDQLSFEDDSTESRRR